jgi:hypothetical protein
VQDELDEMKNAELAQWQEHQSSVQTAVQELNRMLQEVQ